MDAAGSATGPNENQVLFYMTASLQNSVQFSDILRDTGGVQMSQDRIIPVLAVLVASLSYAAPACAYLDPGTGSMILQGIIATVAGILVAGRLYWQRVKTFFAGLVSGDNSTDDPSAASSMDADAAELASRDDDR